MVPLRRCALACAVAISACGGDDGASSGTGTSSATASGSAGSSGTSRGTGSQTAGTGTASGTSTTAGTSTTTTSSDTGTGTGPGTSGTTGGGASPECMGNQDCKIHEDCCTCEVVPADETPADCESECTQTACAAIDYKGEAACIDGICRFPETTCDPSGVVCGAPTPSCPSDALPEVQGQCWSFKCVPISACDWVPDCSYCNPASEVCVIEQTEFGPRHDCEPIPWECGDGPADCACAGKLCEAPFDTCSEGQPGTLQCDCPNCG
ncbi:MAG: hypothetical protein D6705_12395 [Deltaproteobacteria bacterium]|nr:MAG: hypothetical protein D6705_12395 [Deltaproteobacteria bacterium]